MKRASLFLKLCYCVNLLALLLSVALASLGPSAPLDDVARLASLLTCLGTLALLLLGVYRVGVVVLTPGTLDAWPVPGPVSALRHAGIAGMAGGALLGLSNGLRAWTMHPGDAAWNAAPLLALAGGIGLLGLVMFELSRLMSFEQRARDELSPQRLRPSPAFEGHSDLDRRRR